MRVEINDEMALAWAICKTLTPVQLAAFAHQCMQLAMLSMDFDMIDAALPDAGDGSPGYVVAARLGMVEPLKAVVGSLRLRGHCVKVGLAETPLSDDRKAGA